MLDKYIFSLHQCESTSVEINNINLYQLRFKTLKLMIYNTRVNQGAFISFDFAIAQILPVNTNMTSTKWLKKHTRIRIVLF